MALFKLTFGYDGTDFVGSQRQRRGRTVQAELESAVESVTREQVRLAFAGRTDRGVHAVGQVASGEFNWTQSDEKLRLALNSLTGNDLVVSKVERAEDGFHARYSAAWREYRYRIVESGVEPVLSRRYAWWRRDTIEPGAASGACKRFVGRHSFGSFASSGRSRSMTSAELERTVHRCEWVALETGDFVQGRLSEIRIVSDGFLPQMVRNIAGAVVSVGTGEHPVEWIDELLIAGDRSEMRSGAPPQGLVLWQVGYDKFESGPEA